jgi:hypothetical protein
VTQHDSSAKEMDSLAFKMMKKMGWTPGTGLGSNGQGIKLPIESSWPRIGKGGIGFITEVRILSEPLSLQQWTEHFMQHPHVNVRVLKPLVF